MIDSTIAIVQEALQAMGHEPMPLKIYEFFNISHTKSWSNLNKLNWTQECFLKHQT